MKHVVVRQEQSGFWLDPTAYLTVLPEIGEVLPPGARAFALDSGHYDFASPQCVKDLKLAAVERFGDATATVRFTANQWKHDCGLRLTYRDVVVLSLEPNIPLIPGTEDGLLGSHGSVLLDELLPGDAGFTHEVLLSKGVLRVTAGDVLAAWV